LLLARHQSKEIELHLQAYDFPIFKIP